MLSRLRPTRRLSFARVLVTWALVAAQAHTAAGSPVGRLGRAVGSGGPHPCQAKGCGCDTLADALNCCCSTDREKAAWALGPQPPCADAACASPPAEPEPVCPNCRAETTPKPSPPPDRPCCQNTEPAKSAAPSRIPGVNCRGCVKGTGMLAAVFGEPALPPAPEGEQYPLPPAGRVPHGHESAPVYHLAPPTPPPNLR